MVSAGGTAAAASSGQAAGTRRGQQQQRQQRSLGESADAATLRRLQDYARAKRVPLYTRATLRKHKPGPYQRGGGQRGAGRRRGGGRDDGEHGGAESPVGPDKPSRFFLKLVDKEHSSNYGKDTLFIVCRSASFRHTRLEPVSFGRSLWHGPDREGVLELGWLGDDGAPPLPPNKEVGVCVIRGPAVSSELTMLDTLRSLSTKSDCSTLPLLPTILRPTQQACATDILTTAPSLDGSEGNDSAGPIRDILHRTIQRFRLNPEQSSVLAVAACNWFTDGTEAASKQPQQTSPAQPPENVLLVHGVFGAGKSTTLQALVVLLAALGAASPAVQLRQLPGESPPLPSPPSSPPSSSSSSSAAAAAAAAPARAPRVVVVGLTNMAVDSTISSS
jgi:hypothetical protein